MQLIKTLNII